MAKTFTCVIHGGAGSMTPPAKSDKKKWAEYQAAEASLRDTLAIAYNILSKGGPAIGE